MSEAQPLPHRYTVCSAAKPEGPLSVSSQLVEDFEVSPPAEFGGPGDRWSPETLFVAAIASCFELSFRAIARAGRLDWRELHCEAEAVLDRVEKVVQFSSVLIRATIVITDRTQSDKARRLLEKAEQTCLVSNSINCDVKLEAGIKVA